ncbi:MAG: hypothetical protein FD180_3619 [Planctomycetota bacterium]|nr:MAG: hypothetical protein FD180_3619 [Planctomycetota bacterium]
MAAFYANENFPLPVVVALRALGHDVLTSLEAGNAGRAVPDEQVLEFACKAKRAVLTLNRKHFIRLHASRPAHEGIVVCTVDADFVGQASRIDEVLRNFVILPGQLVRVNRPSR